MNLGRVLYSFPKFVDKYSCTGEWLQHTFNLPNVSFHFLHLSTEGGCDECRIKINSYRYIAITDEV